MDGAGTERDDDRHCYPAPSAMGSAISVRLVAGALAETGRGILLINWLPGAIPVPLLAVQRSQPIDTSTTSWPR